MAAKTKSFLYFRYKLLHNFWFLHDFELINLYLMFFDKNDLYLTFIFKMATTNTQIKTFFMHVNFNIINNICLLEIWKINYLFRRLGCKAFEAMFKYSIL